MNVNLKPHNYKRIKGTTQVRLISTDPYSRFCMGGESVLYVQRGQVFPEESPAIPFEDVPEFVKLALERMDVAGRLRVGFTDKVMAELMDDEDYGQEEDKSDKSEQDEEDDYDDMTKKELKAYIAKEELDITVSKKSVDELRAAIREVEAEEGED